MLSTGDLPGASHLHAEAGLAHELTLLLERRMSGLWPLGVVKAAVTLWLITVSVWDVLRRRIPNGLVLPVMFSAFLWQLYFSITNRSSDVLFVLVSWFIIFMLWRMSVFGGGDAKLLMGLFAMFPNQRFLLVLCLGMLAITIPLLLYKIGRALWSRMARSRQAAGKTPSPEQKPVYTGGGFAEWFARLPVAMHTVRARISWPTREALQSKGKPFAWVFALPGVVYTWWFL